LRWRHHRRVTSCRCWARAGRGPCGGGC
jgi:hypothetical protein